MRTAWLLAAAGLLVTTTAASADFLAIDLDYEYSGAAQPSGPSPWLRAEFSSSAAGEVDLKLINLLNTPGEKVGMWMFNLDPALSAAGLTINYVGGQAADAALAGQNAFKAAGNGDFDILFDFALSGDTFGLGESAMYRITGAGITANSFAFLSQNIPGGKDGLMSVAHVQGIGLNGEFSGWIAGGGDSPPAVPLPAPLALGAAGLGLAAGVRAVMRRK